MTRVSILSSVVLGLVLASTVSAAKDARVALVIGNGRYVSTTRLPNAPNDARAVAHALRNLGFEVAAVIDADRPRLALEVERFRAALHQASASLFFYAGHGLQIDGENYLVPIDASFEDETDLASRLIGLSGVVSSAQNGPKVNLVFLDACRNNPLADALKQTVAQRSRLVTIGVRPVRNVGQGLAEMRAGIGTLIAYATAPDNVAEDGQGDHSPFTQSFLRHISEPGLEVRQFLTKVRLDVVKATDRRQVPWDHSSLTENFYFVPPVPPKRPPMPPP